ncbi:hypothetical protein KC973_03355 [Candidatus Saccharibacteria bacterium]|nr:hypothetical protein [Candidatus Saccharibacteria bacterium]
MAVINRSGELIRIEEQAVMPFFNTIGGEESYEYADKIAEWAITPLDLPDDAPYLDILHALMMATAQDCAEAGYYARGKDFVKSPDTSFYSSLLDTRGVTEAHVANMLSLGEDSWHRATFNERSTYRYCIAEALEEVGVERMVLPSDRELCVIGIVNVISRGFMQAARRSAKQGYVWGETGTPPVQLPDQRLLEQVGYNQRISGLRTQNSRSLQEAVDLRAAELEIDRLFDELSPA